MEPRVGCRSRRRTECATGEPELWIVGLVTRFGVVREGGVPTADGFGLTTGAICTSREPAGARTVTQRAATEVRVWGPAPSGVQLYNFTGVCVSDTADDEARMPFVSSMRATGTTPSVGALSGGMSAVQEVHNDDFAGLVSVDGTIRRSLPRGQFASMRSTYTVKTDLTLRLVDPETSG